MTLLLPPPVPLPLPAGDPGALDELASTVTGGAFSLGLLGDHLAGPAAAVHDWLGRDAEAAAAQVAALGRLVAAERDAVTGVLGRLEEHAALARAAVARVRALRERQQEDARSALARLEGGLPGAEAAAVVEAFREAEADRARAHARLLAGLADDAAATARALTAATAVVGGTGAPGDEARVTRSLAALLPGWGEPELTARGRALAGRLSGPVQAERLDALAAEGADWAGAPSFAGALLAGLGADGVRFLLAAAGEDPDATGVARLLAAALGSAAGAAVDGPALVPGGDRDGTPDAVVLGMAAVLAAAARGPGPGPLPRTLVSWGAAVLARETAQQVPAGARVPRAAGEDAVAGVVALLAKRADPAAAAELLTAPGALPRLLGRGWSDGGAALGRLVDLAAAGPGGGEVARAVLVALGEGLGPGGGVWTVDEQVLDRLAPDLAGSVQRHPAEAARLLRLAAAGTALPAADDAALRGLGVLTWRPAVVPALASALAAEVAGAGGDDAPVVLGGLVAVQGYGARLAHAVHEARARDRAVSRRLVVDLATAPLQVAQSTAASVVGLPLPFLTHAAGLDGTWQPEVDRGPVPTARDAAAAGAPSGDLEGARAAAAAFTATARALGTPAPPLPPDWTWYTTLLEALPVPEKERFWEGGWWRTGTPLHR